MLKVILSAGLLMASFAAPCQKNKAKADMTWLPLEKAQENWQAERKPYLIKVYTDWCQICKTMDNTTWKNGDLVDYVSKNFYPIKFNAESKEDAVWRGNTFSFKPAYKVHMLAAEWLLGNMIYPSTVIIPPDGEPVILPGLMTARELEPVLQYFGGKYYLTTEWALFKEKYKSTWK